MDRTKTMTIDEVADAIGGVSLAFCNLMAEAGMGDPQDVRIRLARDVMAISERMIATSATVGGEAVKVVGAILIAASAGDDEIVEQ